MFHDSSTPKKRNLALESAVKQQSSVRGILKVEGAVGFQKGETRALDGASDGAILQSKRNDVRDKTSSWHYRTVSDGISRLVHRSVINLSIEDDGVVQKSKNLAHGRGLGWSDF